MKEKLIVVDIGCGGKNNLHAYHYVGEPTVAFDVNREFLERRKAECGDGNLIEADAAVLPLANSSADSVFAIHSLEHVENFKASLDEIARITKEGGLLTVAVPHARYEAVMSRMDDDYHSDKMHRRVVKGTDLVAELSERGFEVINSYNRGFLLAVYTTGMYFLHRKVFKDRYMEGQSGCLLKDGDYRQVSTTKGIAEKIKIKLRSNKLRRMFALFDKVYPFETYVDAVKNFTNPSETPGPTS
jgi:SAM-dependent methyltransferase